MKKIYGFLGRILPKKLRKKYGQLLIYSSIKTRPDIFLGKSIFFGIFFAAISGFLVEKFELITPYIIFPSVFISVQIIVYVYVSLSASAKGRLVDESLPDALQLMSSNIRAGLTTDKALLMAARPEFGPLEEEIRRIGKETMAGKNLVDSLKKTTERINSHDLERTTELMIYSINSGGQLADLLDETADDIRDQQMLRKEISASVLMYVIFIFIAIVIGAPVLFALSGFLVEILTTNMNMIANEMPSDFGQTMGGSMPISMTKSSITTGFIKTYSMASLLASCFFGSMVVGLILKGEEKEGLKYLPAMLVIGFILFIIGSWVLKVTLGGMVTA